ncbi:MAG: DUF5615 family PIN-like protein [Bacteroidota bacterium]
MPPGVWKRSKYHWVPLEPRADCHRHEPVSSVGICSAGGGLGSHTLVRYCAPSAPDDAILKWAAENEAAIFTHDLDFGTFLASMHRDRPSVIQVRAQDVMPRGLKSVVLGALDQVASHLAEGALVTVEPHRVRIRILPL